MTAVVTVAGIWVLLIAMWSAMEARWYILAPFALLTLPAIFDAWRGRSSEFHMDDKDISWRSGKLEDSILIANIEKAGIRTRLDLSRRVRFYLRDGTRAIVPPDATPPGNAVQTALHARGIRVDQEFFG